MATLDDTSNFIAAAIETSVVQIYTGANEPKSAKEALTYQTMSLRLNARQQGTLGSVLATVPKYFQDAIRTREKLLAIAKFLLEAIAIVDQ